MPGLINTHTHVPMAYFKGLADDLALKEWLEKHIWPAEKKILSPAFVYESTRFGCLEMIRGGTTTIADMYFFGDSVARAVKEMGMRAIIAPTILDFPTAAASTLNEYLHDAESYIRNWLHDDLITPSIAPHSPYAACDETYKKSKEIAQRYNVPLQTHLAEAAWEIDKTRKDYGKRPTEFLDALGILDENVIAAHCVWLDDDEIEILAKRAVGVAHCMESNIKMAAGVAPIVKMLKAGVKIGIGTDSVVSNNDLDMLSEASTVAKVHKVIAMDPTVVDAKTALFMATRGGARVLGMENKIGCLAEGYLADVISVNLLQPHLMPLYNLYSHLIYAARAADIETVMVHGKLLMENKQMQLCSENELMVRALEWQKKIVD